MKMRQKRRARMARTMWANYAAAAWIAHARRTIKAITLLRQGEPMTPIELGTRMHEMLADLGAPPT